jgi:ABC-type transport system involved in multi-copper enzyme maturation permease subunit
MYFVDNPVLQSELLVNLRRPRMFVLLAAYVALLGGVVFLAWPAEKKLDMTNPEAAQRLINLFFLGQYLIATLMTPSFAAGAITGEKERKTYEMLLASPLRPGAIVLGKLLASLCHIAILVFSSLPIVMLCLPLGGVSVYEVLALYWALMLAVATCGMVSIACSSYFQRTAASLIVSYVAILPLALLGLGFWWLFEGGAASFRLFITMTVLPVFCAFVCGGLFMNTARRLMYPPDVGSEGKEVVDEQQELKQAVGMIIQRDEFPDRLFAPPKRDDLLEDGVNPMYDKEMRSELFSQGTLMLRVVIQVSMVLALPMMAVCLYFWPQYAPWYIGYVVLFNMLVGPVFSAGSVTSERERETLDLLLVTTLSPWQILWGKLLSGLRVSSVLTSFLMWPLALACPLNPYFWENWPAVLGFVAVVLVVCLTTAMIALFCSVVFHKTTTSMMTAYLTIVGLFMLPPALSRFADTFFANTAAAAEVRMLTALSPFSAIFNLPLSADGSTEAWPGRPEIYWAFFAIYLALDLALIVGMMWLFNRRWRVSG